MWKVKEMGVAAAVGGSETRYRRGRTGKVRQRVRPNVLQPPGVDTVPDTENYGMAAKVVDMPTRPGAALRVMSKSGGQTAGSQCTSGVGVISVRKPESPQPADSDRLVPSQAHEKDVGTLLVLPDGRRNSGYRSIRLHLP